jgi:hypothetical protein
MSRPLYELSDEKLAQYLRTLWQPETPAAIDLIAEALARLLVRREEPKQGEKR